MRLLNRNRSFGAGTVEARTPLRNQWEQAIVESVCREDGVNLYETMRDSIIT